jgi:uncharacterized linocin/CFP29 family protein
MTDYKILDANTPDGLEAANGSRPLIVSNARTGQTQVVVTNARGMQVNSLLRKDEWEQLDQAVVEAARQRLIGVSDLQTAGLVTRLGGSGTLVSQWNQGSEMSGASINLTGQGPRDLDRVDFKLAGVPIPVIYKDYDIPVRQLNAARRLGNAIDTTHAFAAARVVSEGLEGMLFNGNGTTLNGNTIYGYTNHPSRSTDTAGNYGGGDWGTITNIVPTILGMVAAANAKKYYGPFVVYVANAQYVQALSTFTDGSGQTALARALQLPMISAIKASDYLAATNVVLVQMTPDVIDLAIGQEMVNLEWMSGDGMVGHFKVMTIAAPRVKADYSGNSGIVHATGA